MNRFSSERLFPGIIFTLLLTLACGLPGCSEDIEFEGAAQGSFQYWCLVSGGEWGGTEKPNTCRCGTAECGHGIVCKTVSNGEFDCAAPPKTSND